MNEQLPDGLQLAIQYCNIGTTQDRRNFAEDAIRSEHAQRLTLQHHACDQAQRIADLERHAANLVAESEAKIPAMQAAFEERLTLDRANRLLVKRIADLETKCVTLKELHDAAADERDALRARLAEIEAQEPVMWQARFDDGGWQYCAKKHYDAVVADPSRWNKTRKYEVRALYARPVPAQAVPDADGARFRWLCEDHSDSETREQCRSLIGRLPGMSYSAAVMSIDAAMAAAPEHKA